MHSLNILIKYARMYGYGHKRTEAQFEITWKELQQGLPTTGDAGFLLGVSDNKLLLDGIPLEAGNAERSFATLLNTAGLASLHFSKDVTEEDFVRLVRAFTVGGSKAQDVSKQIKEALSANKNGGTIKINEVKFVAADPLTGDVSIAAQIAAQTLGPEFKQWLNDPQKLLQLIAAAEGANAGSGGGGGTGDGGGGGTGSGGGQGAAPGVPMVPLGSVPNMPRGKGRSVLTALRSELQAELARAARLGRLRRGLAAWFPCRSRKSFRLSGCSLGSDRCSRIRTSKKKTSRRN